MERQRYKRPTWIAKLHPTLRVKVNAEIDCNCEYAAAIYRRWNLVRFIGPRSFRQYAMLRRRKIQEYERRRRRKAYKK